MMLKPIPNLLTDDAHKTDDASSGLRLLIFANGSACLPDSLGDQITAIDPDASIKRKWHSVVDELEKNCFDACDIIIDTCDDVRRAAARIDEIWRLRVKANYAMRPAYLVVGKTSHPMARFEIERRGDPRIVRTGADVTPRPRMRLRNRRFTCLPQRDRITQPVM